MIDVLEYVIDLAFALAIAWIFVAWWERRRGR